MLLLLLCYCGCSATAAAGYNCAQTDGSVGAVINSVRVNTVGQPGQYLKMGVLALLYTLQVQC